MAAAGTEAPPSSRTVLVVGASRGIGLELVQQLKSRGNNVIGTCRGTTPSEELVSACDKVISDVDVSQDDCKQVLAAGLAGEELHAYCHVSGVAYQSWALQRLSDSPVEEFQRQMNVNLMGAVRAVSIVKPHVSKGGKIMLFTSRMGSIDDNRSGGFYEYRCSKAALNAFGVSLAYECRPDNIAVQLIHPGHVATDMTGGTGISTAESVQGCLSRLVGASVIGGVAGA